jgi:membrane-bound inhibitor of C-type lysozyme
MASHGQHDLVYDDSLGYFTCSRCGVMCDEGYNERMIIADMTSKEYSGEASYIIGCYDQWGSKDWVWSLSLVLPDMEIELDSSVMTYTGNRRILINAADVARIATEHGYKCGEYRIRVTAINSEDGHKQSVYLNGHALVLNHTDGGECDSVCTEVYRCACCGESEALKKETVIPHACVETISVEHVYDGEGNRTTHRISRIYCEHCEYEYIYETTQTYTPWGECLAFSEKHTDK